MSNKSKYNSNSLPMYDSMCPKCVHCTGNSEIPTKSSTRSRWLIDSGASVHCVNNKSMLKSVYKDRHRTVIQTADKSKVKVHAVGSCEITLIDVHNRPRVYTLHNVVYHPSFPINLLSSSSLLKHNKISTQKQTLPIS